MPLHHDVDRLEKGTDLPQPGLIPTRAAVETHRTAGAAYDAGFYADLVIPFEGLTEDNNMRRDSSLEKLAKLRPAFSKDGTVTAGNASGINDGAAALVLASEEAVAEHDLKPIARIVAYGHAGVDPNFMGMGPVPATRAALVRAGLSVADMDVIESNEAFAAQACAVSDALGFDPAKVNPNGSGISLGHPGGATGAIIVTKLVHELARVGGRYGLATMCIGGGQGIALVVERV